VAVSRVEVTMTMTMPMTMTMTMPAAPEAQAVVGVVVIELGRAWRGPSTRGVRCAMHRVGGAASGVALGGARLCGPRAWCPAVKLGQTLHMATRCDGVVADVDCGEACTRPVCLCLANPRGRHSSHGMPWAPDVEKVCKLCVLVWRPWVMGPWCWLNTLMDARADPASTQCAARRPV